MGVKVHRLKDEHRRRQAYGLLRRRIDDDQVLDYLPVVNAHVGSHPIPQSLEVMFAVLGRGGEPVAAAYVGPDWNDLVRGIQWGWDQQMIADLRDHVMYLHAVAVSEDEAGKGLGSALLQEAEAYAAASRYRAIVGVADPGSIAFYVRHGYQPLGRGATLVVQLSIAGGDLAVVHFPMEGESQWFVKPLVAQRTVGVLRRGEIEWFAAE